MQLWTGKETTVKEPCNSSLILRLSTSSPPFQNSRTEVEAEKNAISLLEFLYLVPLLSFYFQLLTTTSQSVFETIYFEDAE